MQVPPGPHFRFFWGGLRRGIAGSSGRSSTELLEGPLA